MSFTTCKDALSFLVRKLNKPQSKLEAEWILCEVLNLSKAEIYLNQTISPFQQKLILNALKRRLSYEPLQYIFSKTNFYGIDLFVGRGVLIPRPETEVLVKKILSVLDEDDKMLDICTGSGAIPIALLSQMPKLTIIASDISLEALEFAQKNFSVQQVDVTLIHSDIFTNIPLQKFDLISANPPYIATAIYENLDKEVIDFEPEIALHASFDGLKVIRRIIQDAKMYLKDGGHLFLEVCSTHISEVKEIFEQEQYNGIRTFDDYAGRKRFLMGKR